MHNIRDTLAQELRGFVMHVIALTTDILYTSKYFSTIIMEEELMFPVLFFGYTSVVQW